MSTIEVARGLSEIDLANPNNFHDCLRAIKREGFGETDSESGLGTLINLLIAQGNQSSSSVAAARAVTYAGTATAGDVLTLNLDGEAYSHTVVDGTTVTTAMTEMKVALNADPDYSARWLASNVAGVLTSTALRKGVGANSWLFSASKVGTGTFVAAGATFTGGSGVDDLLPIVD